jgi:cell wall-associated NlpC family hydrolase
MREPRRPGPRIMEQFLGKPFAHNGGAGRPGYDCMGLIYAYLMEMGIPDVPTSFQGITLDNYTDFYLADRARADAVLLDLFDTLGAPVEGDRPVAGDLCIVRHGDGTHFPCIYAGNRNIMAAIEGVGVRVVQAGDLEIVKIRRP